MRRPTPQIHAATAWARRDLLAMLSLALLRQSIIRPFRSKGNQPAAARFYQESGVGRRQERLVLRRGESDPGEESRMKRRGMGRLRANADPLVALRANPPPGMG